MRTAGQGQAAAPWERGGPPKVQGPAWAPILGRGRTSPGLSRMWSAIGYVNCSWKKLLSRAVRTAFFVPMLLRDLPERKTLRRWPMCCAPMSPRGDVFSTLLSPYLM